MSKSISLSQLNKHEGEDTTDTLSQSHKSRNTDSVIELRETRKKLKPTTSVKEKNGRHPTGVVSFVNGHSTQKSHSQTQDNEDSDRHSLNGNSLSHHCGHSTEDSSSSTNQPIGVAHIVKSTKINSSPGMGSNYSVVAKHKTTSPGHKSALRTRESSSTHLTPRDKIHRKSVTIAPAASKERKRVHSGNSRQSASTTSNNSDENSISSSTAADKREMTPPTLGSSILPNKEKDVIPVSVTLSSKSSRVESNSEPAVELQTKTSLINAIDKDSPNAQHVCNDNSMTDNALPDQTSDSGRVSEIMLEKQNTLSNGAITADERLPSVKVSNDTKAEDESKKSNVSPEMVEKSEHNDEGTAEEDETEESIKKSLDGRFIRQNEEIGRGSFKTVYKGLDVETGVAVAWCELMVSKIFSCSR